MNNIDIFDLVNHGFNDLSENIFDLSGNIKGLAFKPPNWQRAKAHFVRRGGGRVRTQDPGHRSECADHCATRPGLSGNINNNINDLLKNLIDVSEHINYNTFDLSGNIIIVYLIYQEI